MSIANVQFLTLAGEPCGEGEQPQRFTFRCVRHNRGRDPRLGEIQCARLLIAGAGHGIPRDGQNQNGGRAQWDWDGNREAPTFGPSVNCESACGWHGYIKAGRCVETDGSDSP